MDWGSRAEEFMAFATVWDTLQKRYLTCIGKNVVGVSDGQILQMGN